MRRQRRSVFGANIWLLGAISKYFQLQASDGYARTMGCEIVVNGVNRTYRDRQVVAHAAAILQDPGVGRSQSNPRLRHSAVHVGFVPILTSPEKQLVLLRGSKLTDAVFV
jgi:hypothetical protein